LDHGQAARRAAGAGKIAKAALRKSRNLANLFREVSE
jgi:hypothetical protein